MILRTSVRFEIYPEELIKGCTKAEHAVAVQAERDSRAYIPSKRIAASGRVNGNIITWDEPNARLFYFGNIYVDPKRKIAGFPLRDGTWRSFPGEKKVKSDRKFQFRTGGEQWFYRAKREHIKKWIQLAEGVIARG